MPKFVSPPTSPDVTLYPPSWIKVLVSAVSKLAISFSFREHIDVSVSFHRFFKIREVTGMGADLLDAISVRPLELPRFILPNELLWLFLFDNRTAYAAGVDYVLKHLGHWIPLPS